MTSSAAVTLCTCMMAALLLSVSYGYPTPDDVGVLPLAEVKQSLEPGNDQQPPGLEERGVAVRTLPRYFQRVASPEDMMHVEEQRYGRGYPSPYYYGSSWGGYYPWGGWGQYGGYGGYGRALYYPYAYYG